MKTKNLFRVLPLLAAVMLFASCSSDDANLSEVPVEPEAPAGTVIHYSATVGEESSNTRATLNGSKQYEFQAGDQLLITGTNISGTLTLQDGDAGKTSGATFEGNLTFTGSGSPADDLALNAVLVSTSNQMTTLTYAAAEYPTTAIASTLAEAVEKYSYFTATSTYGAKSFTMAQQTSFLNFTVTLTDGTTTGTALDITIKNGGSTVRTGSVTTATDGGVKAKFVAAMPSGTTMSSATFQLGSKSAVSFGSTTTLVANKIYNISKTISIPGLLTGKFTVDSDGTQVQFSKGNLRYTSGAWSFFDNQWDYYTEYYISADVWDHFGWSTSATSYGKNTSTSSSTYSGDFVDWGATIGTGWRTLTNAEWTYVFYTRTVNGGQGSGKSYTLGQSVNGKLGVVIYPDDYTGSVYAGSDWSTFEAAGCVFLPAAGRRDGTSVNDAGSSGDYWSSSVHPYSTDLVYKVSFYSGGLNTAYSNPRYIGHSVRLVRQVE